MSGRVAWDISGSTHCQTVVSTYFLSLSVRHSYINKTPLTFNQLVVTMTIILRICDSLPQSLLNKRVLFVSENSISIKRALALCSPTYSG